MLQQLEDRLWLAAKPQAAPLRAECVALAAAVLARWPTKPYANDFGQMHYRQQPEEPAPPLLPLLTALGEPDLVKGYVGGVMARDVTADSCFRGSGGRLPPFWSAPSATATTIHCRPG